MQKNIHKNVLVLPKLNRDNLAIDALRIRGESHKIVEIWYSVSHKHAPPVVYVEREERDEQT